MNLKEIGIIINKETKNILVRKAMVKWFFLIIGANILMVLFQPYKDIMPYSVNTAMYSIFLMFAMCFFVPNNLSIDCIGGEKFHKTLETMISFPIKLFNIFLGKSIFIVLIGIISVTISTILDNLILILVYKTSFLDSGLSLYSIFLIYVIGVMFIFIISAIGSCLSLVNNNLKINGYIVSILNIIFVREMYSIIQKNNNGYAIKYIIMLFCASILFFVFVNICVSKKVVMKYIR